MNNYLNYGTILRERRLELGLSQEAVANKASVHRKTVGNAERGDGITLDIFLSLAYALGLEIQIARRT